MYLNHLARIRTARRPAFITAVAATLMVAFATAPKSATAQDFDSASVIRKISGLSEKLELTTNTSRILTLDKNIPRVQVNNPELVAVTPLSATQVQISAKKAGVTQVNLWDEEGNIHSVDVLIYGDARELQVALQTQFPHSTIRVYRYSGSLVLTGFVDRPDHVGPIMRLAEDYAPKVINNIQVGGVQQVLLKVKVYEVSRTKLRRLGVDWALDGASGGFAFNSINDIITKDGNFFFNNEDTFAFGIVDDNDFFFAALDALQRNQVAKILAEPNIVAVSGRPAKFVSGGEFPYAVPQGGSGSGGVFFTIEYKEFGTIIDFVPIVLGNGNIRLEVRPEVSTPDFSLGTETTNTELGAPGFRKRYVETAVEMKAGQTFAIAGLVEERVNTLNRGLPYVSDLPVIGVPFRRMEDEINEIELLIVVTPEFVDPMEPHQVPCGGPGFATTSPDNHDLYCGGHVEVPAHCNPIRGITACGEQAHGYGCSNCQTGAPCGPGGPHGGHPPMITDGVVLPGGVGYDGGQGPSMAAPETVTDQAPYPTTPSDLPEGQPESDQPMINGPDDLQLPGGTEPTNGPADAGGEGPSSETGYFGPQPDYTGRPLGAARTPQYSVPRPYSPQRQPVFVRNASKQNYPQSGAAGAAPGQTGLFGPVGYDPQ
jgi:pilus assembly protein CpaC